MIKGFQLPKRTSSIFRLVVLGTILFGLIVRVRQYVANRSLWLDEALLALNLTDRTLAELAQPLDYDQGAPLGFLFVQKLVLQALANRDYILRLVPLAAGIISLYLFYRVAQRYISKAAIPVALALFATSGTLVYYASEAKQYSSDVAITLLLFIVTAKCFEDTARVGHYIAFGMAGALALWFSHPALFVVGGAGLGLVLDHVAHRSWRRLQWLGLVFIMWAASFTLLYLLSLNSLASNKNIVDYWATGFMPMPPWRDWAWFPAAFTSLFEDPIGLSVIPIAMVASFVGCVSLLRHQWQLGLTLVTPIVLVLLASGLNKYPFAGRLLLFIVPIALLLIAEGVEQTRLLLWRKSRWFSAGVWLALTIALLLAPTLQALQTIRYPQMREEIREVMQYLHQHKEREDLVYVYYGAEFPFKYYAPQFGLGDEPYLVGKNHRVEPEKYIQELNQLSEHGRIWFVFSHVYNWAAVDEEKLHLEHLDSLGTRIDEFRAPGASVYLYEFRTGRL